MSRERAWATRTRTATMRTAPIQIRKARGLIIVLAVPSIDSRRLRGARRAWSRRASEQFADLLGGLRLVYEMGFGNRAPDLDCLRGRALEDPARPLRQSRVLQRSTRVARPAGFTSNAIDSWASSASSTSPRWGQG